jgi:hypothetical protein
VLLLFYPVIVLWSYRDRVGRFSACNVYVGELKKGCSEPNFS